MPSTATNPATPIALANTELAVEISARGAELRRIVYGGRDMLWNGDARYWADRAPNLFPYIARLTEGKYRYDGREYHMAIHGFAKDSLFTVSNQTACAVTFELASNDATRAQYPFDFVFRIHYGLSGPSLAVEYQVLNTGEKAMHFGLGGHPGFALPLEDGPDFSDYYLEFGAPCRPKRVLFSQENFVDGQTDYPLQEDRRLALRHSLFDDDAIVLSGTPGQLALKSTGGAAALSFSYGNFPYLGLWHRPKTEAPYLCIEPWSSLPSRQGVVEDIARQPGLITLPPGEAHAARWSVGFSV